MPREAYCLRPPEIRAGAAAVISPALQRGESVINQASGVPSGRRSCSASFQRFGKKNRKSKTGGIFRKFQTPEPLAKFDGEGNEDHEKAILQIAQRNNQNFCRLYPSISAQSIHEQQPAPRAFPDPCSLFPCQALAPGCSLFPVPCSLFPSP